MVGTFAVRGLDHGKKNAEQQEAHMQVFAAVLNDAYKRKISTHGWHQIQSTTMRTEIASIILDRCKSSKGAQVNTVRISTSQVCAHVSCT